VSVWVPQRAEQRRLFTHLGVVPQSHWAARPQTTNICVSERRVSQCTGSRDACLLIPQTLASARHTHAMAVRGVPRTAVCRSSSRCVCCRLWLRWRGANRAETESEYACPNTHGFCCARVCVSPQDTRTWEWVIVANHLEVAPVTGRAAVCNEDAVEGLVAAPEAG